VPAPFILRFPYETVKSLREPELCPAITSQAATAPATAEQSPITRANCLESVPPAQFKVIADLGNHAASHFVISIFGSLVAANCSSFSMAAWQT
jgi:hypothetical protein